VSYRPIRHLGATDTQQLVSRGVLLRDQAIDVAKVMTLLAVGAAGGAFAGFWLGFYAGRNP
jgi:membrane protein DedA with SNARE-associated domain